MICGECGSPYHRVTVISNGVSKKAWRCKRLNGECHSHFNDESRILEAVGNMDLTLIDKIEIFDKAATKNTFKRFYRPIPVSGYIDVSFN